LGKLFAHVRQKEVLKQRTVILVCSDNGPEPGAGSAGPFRGSKTTLYEGGVRSPLIVWAPGMMKADVGGTEDASVLAAFDLVPSLLSLAGVETPMGVKWDGENRSAVLMGEANATRERPLMWRRPPDRKNWLPHIAEPQPDLAIRDGRWKMLCDYDGTKPQLYDVVSDPGEKNNLAGGEPSEVARMTKLLLEWHQSMPQDKGPSIPAEKLGRKGAKKKKQ
jgi:arylsulfatase A-like enzyme